MPQPFFARRHTGSASRTTVAAGAFVEYYDRTMAKAFKRVYWWGKTATARVPPPKLRCARDATCAYAETAQVNAVAKQVMDGKLSW